ncbi:MAG: hypothetical protein WCE44_11945 [Candidatus Velthaea sp.]
MKSPPLWRFLLVSAIIVTVAGSVLFARRQLGVDIRVSATPAGSPTPTLEHRSAGADEPQPAQTFTASAPWIMSALPGCFVESERATGRLGAMRNKFPAADARIQPGAAFVSGECHVEVLGDAVIVERGTDRMRAPHARLYRVAGRLVLVTIANGTADIRTY